MATTTYVAKLIYLPDYSRPMSVAMESGWFGTASLQLTFQDGWMLTNVSTTGDNTKLLDSLSTVISAFAGGGSGGSSKGGGGSGNGAPGGPPGTSHVLQPGLYSFTYDSEGNLQSLCQVSYFDETGSHAAKPEKGCSSNEGERATKPTVK